MCYLGHSADILVAVSIGQINILKRGIKIFGGVITQR